MEEKKAIKIKMPMILLTISFIIILVMGYFLYNTNIKIAYMTSNEKKLNDTIQTLNNTIATSIQPTQTNIEKKAEDKMSFSETMDLLYTKEGTPIESKGETRTEKAPCVNNFPSDSIFAQMSDDSEKMINMEYTDVEVYDEGINLNIKKAGSKDLISTSITGIPEEVVSIKVLSREVEAIPAIICLLTRNGNVYYLTGEMIDSNNFVAKKVENISEVVSIEEIDVEYQGSMHLNRTIIANTYNKEKIDILAYSIHT